MCHKKFDNRFTNKNLTSKNNFEQGFLHVEIEFEREGSHYFPGKLESLNILHVEYIKPI